jgi:hypothetical protein
MRITNIHGLPNAIVRAIQNKRYNRGKSDLTVTQIISPPRKIFLEKLHSKEIVQDASEMILALLGSGVHSCLEQADTEGLVEERMYLERQGVKIGGQFDRLLVEEGLLQDYKTTSAYSIRGNTKPEYEAQLNLLALILRENGYPVDKLEVVAVLRDWSKSRVGSKNYPEAPIVRIPVKMWPIETTEWYLAERLMLHQQVQQGRLPECSDAERWYSGDSYALMKLGRKSAVKVYDDQQEAEEALIKANDEKCYLEHRPGKYLRCLDYCYCSKWCDQWQESQRD